MLCFDSTCPALRGVQLKQRLATEQDVNGEQLDNFDPL